jgi:hypothetical protein
MPHSPKAAQIIMKSKKDEVSGKAFAVAAGTKKFIYQLYLLSWSSHQFHPLPVPTSVLHMAVPTI